MMIMIILVTLVINNVTKIIIIIIIIITHEAFLTHFNEFLTQSKGQKDNGGELEVSH